MTKKEIEKMINHLIIIRGYDRLNILKLSKKEIKAEFKYWNKTLSVENI
ncbi:MAG: hypothetical protein PHH83_05045 [Patescibacteria group bacterium]|nr:hypothetical protein [Patescibacteria group bacterium]